MIDILKPQTGVTADLRFLLSLRFVLYPYLHKQFQKYQNNFSAISLNVSVVCS